MNTNEFLLAEEPFVSIQGEGKTVGIPSYFLRFSGCPVKCSFCDTPYTFDGTEPVIKKSLGEIVENIKVSKINNIVITGGEPLLYQDKIKDLHIELSRINSPLYSMEIETSGILPLTEELVSVLGGTIFNISPKIQYIRDHPKSIDILLKNIQLLWNYKIPFIIKFVYEKDTETDIIKLTDRLIGSCSSYTIAKEIHRRIYIMPECITREEHLERVENTLSFCKKHDFVFSPRIHILLYDKKRRV